MYICDSIMLQTYVTSYGLTYMTLINFALSKKPRKKPNQQTKQKGPLLLLSSSHWQLVNENEDQPLMRNLSKQQLITNTDKDHGLEMVHVFCTKDQDMPDQSPMLINADQ